MKTPVAAEQLGITESHLHYLIRSRKLLPPPKDTSGDYVWSAEHIEAARNALQIDRRRRQAVPA